MDPTILFILGAMGALLSIFGAVGLTWGRRRLGTALLIAAWLEVLVVVVLVAV
jgi:hypothetical protein